MAKKIRLSAETVKAIDSLVDALRQEADDQRTLWDERSERWQEGDAGLAADNWIEEIEALADSLEDAPQQPEE
jgi:hypothetical protein